MKKNLLLKSAVVLLTASTLVTSPVAILAKDSGEEVIATIGEDSITKDDLYEAMKNVSGTITLRTLILEKVLLQSVKDADGLRKQAEDEVKKQVEAAGGEDVFQELLNYQKLGSKEEFTYQLFVSKMFEEVVTREIDMSDEAINKFYENGYKPTMEAQHILVEKEEEATAAIERINNGEEFDAVAKEISKDSTAANGGLLGPFTEGQMVPEFEKAVKELKNGEMTSSPVKSEFGYHVIKVINNGEKKPLNDIKDEVKEQYIQSKFAESEFAYGIVGKLIKDAGYDIKDKDLKDAVEDLLNPEKAPAAPGLPGATPGAPAEDGADTESQAPAEEASAE